MFETKRRIEVLFLLVLIVGIIPFANGKGETEVIEPFFNIDILLPSSGGINFKVIAKEIVIEELAKIGIGVDTIDENTWEFIYQRTFDYPGPYPIPSYDSGGYDILFFDWCWDIDWNPEDLYSNSMCGGNNICQYFSEMMDWALYNYSIASTLDERIYWCKEIQAILYEDLPQISLVYPQLLYPVTQDFNQTSWSGLLWASDYQPMENWSISGKTDFHYASFTEFDEFHIYHCVSVSDAQWLHQIYNGLLERNPISIYTNSYTPRIATSFSTDDGLTYNIKINPAAVWGDGEVLNVSDVEYSFKLMITSEFNSPDFQYWCKYLENSSFNIINEYEIEITFKQPFVFHDTNLGLDLIPKHIWKSVPLADHPEQALLWALSDPSKLVGAGPYYLYEYDYADEIIHLKRNDYFDDWSGITPNCSDIYFEFYPNKENALAALIAGTVDMIDAHFYTSISDIPLEAKYLIADIPVTQEIVINNFHPYLGTGENCPISNSESGKYVRKAISHIVNRDRIIEVYNNSRELPLKAGVSSCPSASIGFDTTLQPYEYNLTKAKEYMNLAGFVYPSESGTIGLSIGLETIFNLFALLGGSLLIFRKRKEQSKI